jgi:hypothetical protein
VYVVLEERVLPNAPREARWNGGARRRARAMPGTRNRCHHTMTARADARAAPTIPALSDSCYIRLLFRP